MRTRYASRLQPFLGVVAVGLTSLPLVLGCGSNEKPAQKTVDNDMMTISPVEKSSRRDDVEMTKVFELKTGMTEGEVLSLLGEPHEKQQTLIKATPFTKERNTETWTYRGAHKDDFIMMGFEDGRITSGGSSGWDFEMGFIGTPSEKKRIIEHYQQFIKNGGKPPFDNLNPPAPGGT